MAHVDWFAFTQPLPGATDGAGEATFALIDKFVRTDTLRSLSPILSNDNGEFHKGTGWYRTAYVYEYPRVRLSYGSLNPNAHLELSGLTCEQVRYAGLLDELIKDNAHLASRIDIAQDFDADSFGPVASLNYNKRRFKAHTVMCSPDGDTLYIGSWNSERFCRVYQFHPPHPRAGRVRVEFVLKGDAAKAYASATWKGGPDEPFLALSHDFGIATAIGLSRSSTAPKVQRSTRGKGPGSWYRWALNVAVPAALEAHRLGIVDLRETLDDLDK